MIINCTECLKEFNKAPSQMKRTSNHFCSQSCSAIHNNKIYKKKEDKFCLYCNTILDKRSKTYCSISCQRQKEVSEYIERWKNGLETGIVGLGTSQAIKKYMLLKHNNACSRCNWSEINPYTNTLPLELEHIDGDYTNNKEDNLTILCPNCHSLTKTYRGANVGKGTRKLASPLS